MSKGISFDLLMDHGIDTHTRTLHWITSFAADGDSEAKELIGSHWAERALLGLHILDTGSRASEPIRIILATPGGAVDPGLAVYDRIRHLRSEVTIDVYGACHSMGVWILQAADIRRMSPNSSLMIHTGESSVEGVSKRTMSNWYKFGQEQEDRCVSILLERMRERNPGLSKRTLEKLLEADTLYWPEQAVALGLADTIITD